MKRFLSCILAITLVICMIPETVGIAFADDSVQAETLEETAAVVAAEPSEDIVTEDTASEEETVTPIEVAEPMFAAAATEETAAEDTAAEDTEETAVTEEATEAETTPSAARINGNDRQACSVPVLSI